VTGGRVSRIYWYREWKYRDDEGIEGYLVSHPGQLSLAVPPCT